MNHWAWRADVQQLAQLFENTLPVFDRYTLRLYTRFYDARCDVDIRMPVQAIRPASLTVFDGEKFLHRQPMMYGKWRRNGLPGTAPVTVGLQELMATTARRDDAALCVLSDTTIHQSETARYFTLYRVHADRLVGWKPETVASLLRICRARTALLHDRLSELSTESQPAARLPQTVMSLACRQAQ